MWVMVQTCSICVQLQTTGKGVHTQGLDLRWYFFVYIPYTQKKNIQC